MRLRTQTKLYEFVADYYWNHTSDNNHFSQETNCKNKQIIRPNRYELQQ